ncbi:MAG: hypothetical protein ACUVR3_04480 [Candidatus Roseilinea sp.]|uniref:hypothetical protein n=1 Tax=Candidatus Roseilinea sp. TaxID=2838777 RepID=UPI00404B1B96
MEDEFMSRLREDPRPDFKRDLKQRLSLAEATQTLSAPRRFVNGKLVLSGLVGILVVALTVSPSAQVLAQEFLNLFRVKRIVAVPINPDTISQFSSAKLDIESMLSSSVEVLQEPADPQMVSSLAEASQLAGIPVRAPTRIPDILSGPEIWVQGQGAVRFTADTAKLRTVVDLLGMTDVTIPAALDGATVTIAMPPAVALAYRERSDTASVGVVFMQASNPEIVLPEGVRLAELGELALRLSGMTPDAARQLAQTIDWSSTLLVPIPANAATVSEVQVRGVPGLLIVATAPVSGAVTLGDEQVTQYATLLWSEGDTVHAATGNVDQATLLEMANSMQ